MALRGLDFEGLASVLLSRSRELLPQWLPGGRIIGNEYVCSDIRGGSGSSFKVNVQKGVWKDFADSSVGGGDLISLYAAIEGLENGEAAKRLAEQIGYNLKQSNGHANGNGHSHSDPEQETDLIPPPTGAPAPNMNHFKFGEPTRTWCYLSPGGSPMFYVARYDPPNERKQFLPWSWSQSQEKWVLKAWSQPRPLYGLDLLELHPNKPVLIVEGEKACDAARELAGSVYVVVTWPGGSQAVDKADWRPIYGRKILIWPDADQAGIKAGERLASFLVEHSPEVKFIELGERDGWDAADAVAEGWTWATFKDWAKPIATIYKRAEPLTPEVLPPKSLTPKLEVDVSVTTDEDHDPGVSLVATWEQLGVVTAKNGQPVCNAENVRRIIEGWPEFKDLIWFDEFHMKYFTRWRSNETREWTEIDGLNLMVTLQRELGFLRISEQTVHQAVMVYANKQIRNEPKDWMESLTWDGTPRLEGFFVECFGAEDNEYIRAASKNWWISMAARIYRPGCKVDTMVILEGGQGRFKSTALNVIGGRWYTESHESVQSKDFYLVMQGKLLIEISELDAFSRAEVNTIKRVITCQSDRFRPPYGRTPQDYPRRCVLVGTTNEEEYLRDPTGGRRFWPVKIGVIDVGRIKELREQLFAEAVARLKQDEPWWIMPQEATVAEQATRRQTDEWEDIIADFLIGKTEVSVTQIATEALRIDVGKLDKSTQIRIAKSLHQIGWERHQAWRINRNVKIWRRRGSEQDTIPF